MKKRKKAQRHYKITKLLIANRGEIALRIRRAALKRGIEPVIVCSEADKDQSYVALFKEVVVLTGQKASDTYLSIEKIIAAALQADCDAVHPGYGFLSENAECAKAVADAGLIWVGPSSSVIEKLGSKTSARALAKKCKVPIVPGTGGNLSDEKLIREAKKMKFPLLIKATAGGGGRGMRIVKDLHSLAPEIARARAEAKKFFSNPDVFIERYIDSPRHVEVQLFGDDKGTLVHFGTRDCTAQRRYQKIIEEAPAPFLSTVVRRKIEQAAIKIAKAAKYTNAGTAEFIVKGNEFFFLEINTRIQVEHPVTEIAYDVDLVDLQLHVANGGKIPSNYKKRAPIAYAVECRVYAESVPGFMPSLGTIEQLDIPFDEERVRVDFGFIQGDIIGPYYDAMIGKIICKGEKRTETLAFLKRFLRDVQIGGVESNIEFLQALLSHKQFCDGTLSIQSIDRFLDTFQEEFKSSGKGEETYALSPRTFPKTIIGKKGECYLIDVIKKGQYFVAHAVKQQKKLGKPLYICRSLHAQSAIDALLGKFNAKG